MFGYVRPDRAHLTDEAWERYRAAYCGLCRCLGKTYGPAARYILRYDFVFLVLLLEEGEACQTRRCPRHPLGGRPCLEESQALELCAGESVILAYYQLSDGVADGAFFHRLGCRLARRTLKAAYRRASAACGGFDRQVGQCLRELDGLERARSPQMDRAADAFARLLAAAAPETGDAALDRPRRQLLYHLGRWIYLVDAVDDLEEDARRGRYNPVAARYGEAADRAALAVTLGHSLALAQSAFQLLPRTSWSDLLENILYLGLSGVQQLVLTGQWHKKERDKQEITL